MKTNRVLKTLIDILFILHCVGLIGFLFILPFGIFSINIAEAPVTSYKELTELPILYWMGIALSFLSYIIFLFGLYYLRRTANYVLNNNFMQIQVIENLKRSGNMFSIAGVFLMVTYAIFWLSRLSLGTIKLTYGTNLMIPLFLIIIGLFFILQSNALFKAKSIKEENDLTI